MGDGEADAVAEAVGDVTETVVADALEGAQARAEQAEAVAEAIQDAALATAQGQHIEQVEQKTWREIALLRELVAALEARLAQQQEQLSTLTGTLLLSSEEQTALIAFLATQSTPTPPPTPPEPEPSPSAVDPAAVVESPAESQAESRDPPKRRHKFL